MRDYVFYLEPDEDITAYELALILMLQRPTLQWIDIDHDILHKQYPQLERHLRKGARGETIAETTSGSIATIVDSLG